MGVFDVTVYGLVQGIGFRPYIAEYAEKNGIIGNVRNSGGIVRILARCDEKEIGKLTYHIRYNCPKGGRVDSIVVKPAEEPVPEEGFEIVSSDTTAGELRFLPSDIATCPECEAELFDKNNRRYRYPFISCTACGPRYSIMKKIPYDRDTITMDRFAMCPECEAEYTAKGDRRRHAQTIGCKNCGPQLEYYVNQVRSRVSVVVQDINMTQDEILDKTVQNLREGKIAAIKDIGGFHFVFVPTLEEPARRLRKFKNREAKPFAVMFPDMKSIRRYCNVSEKEEELLKSEARPIVLLEKNGIRDFVKEVCGEVDRIGAMLPCNPLQMILTRELGPLVMTSGNRGGEPIIINEDDMAPYLEDGIDFMLTNDREVLTPLDDSVVQVTKVGSGDSTREVVQFIRRARGYVPEPIMIDADVDKPLLAAGGDLKSVFALAKESAVYLSEHFGDLSEMSAMEARAYTIDQMKDILAVQPEHYVCDMHPGYHSVRDTEARAEVAENDFMLTNVDAGKTNGFKNKYQIQHHIAHVMSVVAEHRLSGKVMGLAFDGTGYGLDGTIWGSEIFSGDLDNGVMNRVASLLPVKLMGGDMGAKDAKTILCCYLKAAEDRLLISHEELVKTMMRIGVDGSDYNMIKASLQADINTYYSSSMGRLFDAASALIGVRSINTYEGECPIMLEQAALRAKNKGYKCTGALELNLIEPKSEDDIYGFDQVSFLIDLLENYNKKTRGLTNKEDIQKVADRLAYEFHNAVINAVVEASDEICQRDYVNQVALGGGTMYNRILFSGITELLEDKGYKVYSNNTVPCGDGGIALGQVYGKVTGLCV